MSMKIKKGQMWGMDLVIALVIFSIAMVILYLYTINAPNEGREKMDDLFYDGKIITGNILSEGYPKEWDETSVVKIGILSGNKINITKLERFYNMDYVETKALFDTKYEYYFFLENHMTTIGEDVDGIGKPGINRNNVNGKNLVKITRFVVYEEKPMTAYLYVWEE